jgi:molybdenum-dependent DNA-binding transcriptional regulator ModE
MATEAKVVITAEDRTKAAFNSLSASFGRINGLLGAFGVALSAGAIVSFTRDAIAMAAALDAMAEATGGTVEGLSRIANVAKVSGTDLGSVQKAILELNKAVAGLGDSKDAEAALQAIGLSLAQLDALRPDERLEAVAKAFGQFEDGAGKSAAMLAIFKKNAAEVAPLLKDLAQDTETVGTVSAESAAKAEALEKSFNRVKLEAQKLGLEIADVTIPVLEDLFKIPGDPENSNIVRGFKRAGLEIEAFMARLFLGERGAAGIQAEIDRLMAPKAEPFFQVVKQGRGGVNFRGDTTAAAAKTKDLTAANQRLIEQYRELQEAWNPLALRWEEDLSEATADTERLVEQYRAMQEAWNPLALRWEEDLPQLVEDTKEANDIARELGMTFTSAFEDAIIEGKKFSDVLKGLAQDIGRIILRKTITEPLAGAVGEILKGVIPKFASGTDYVPRDMLAYVHQGEAIIPAGENESRGGVVYNFNVTTTSLDPRAAASVLLQNKALILGMVRDAHNTAGRRTAFA